MTTREEKLQTYRDISKAAAEMILKKFDILEPRCGFSTGPGWVRPIEKCFEKMIAAGWNKDLAQVKQKFCQLRIYIGDRLPPETDPEMRETLGKIMDEAVIACSVLCESCGGARDPEQNWGPAYCEGCKKDWESTR